MGSCPPLGVKRGADTFGVSDLNLCENAVVVLKSYGDLVMLETMMKTMLKSADCSHHSDADTLRSHL